MPTAEEQPAKHLLIASHSVLSFLINYRHLSTMSKNVLTWYNVQDKHDLLLFNQRDESERAMSKEFRALYIFMLVFPPPTSDTGAGFPIEITCCLFVFRKGFISQLLPCRGQQIEARCKSQPGEEEGNHQHAHDCHYDQASSCYVGLCPGTGFDVCPLQQTVFTRGLLQVPSPQLANDHL